MKEIVKEIKREIVDKEVTYVAVDGTEFTSEEECKKYEATAECVLMSRYKPLIVRECTEYDLFNAGSDDSTVEVVKIADAKQADIVLQLYRLFNPHLERKEYQHYIDDAAKKLSVALQGSGYIFIGRGCDNDSFWVIDSQDSIVQNIKEACKPLNNDTEG